METDRSVPYGYANDAIAHAINTAMTDVRTTENEKAALMMIAEMACVVDPTNRDYEYYRFLDELRPDFYRGTLLEGMSAELDEQIAGFDAQITEAGL